MKSKKLLIGLLSALFVATSGVALAGCDVFGETLGVTIDTQQPSQGLRYTLNGDSKSYSVTGMGTCTDTYVVIPATYEGKPVTTIPSYAFYSCDSIRSIAIPDSITGIGPSAFLGCKNLTNYILPI